MMIRSQLSISNYIQYVVLVEILLKVRHCLLTCILIACTIRL